MISRKLIFAVALATVSGAAFAGKSGVPGAGSQGSGTIVISDSTRNATIGYGLVNVAANPGLFTRISNLPGAVTLADGSVTSPPVRMPNGDVVRITVDKDGKIVRIDRV